MKLTLSIIPCPGYDFCIIIGIIYVIHYYCVFIALFILTVAVLNLYYLSFSFYSYFLSRMLCTT